MQGHTNFLGIRSCTYSGVSKTDFMLLTIFVVRTALINARGLSDFKVHLCHSGGWMKSIKLRFYPVTNAVRLVVLVFPGVPNRKLSSGHIST